MKQRVSYLFVFLLSYASFTYSQVSETLSFEQAKLEMLCQAIRFNYRYQGQSAYIKTLDCRSLKALGNSIPSRFKSSTRLYRTYAERSYSQLPDIESRLEKLQKDLIAELESIGQIAHGHNAKKLLEWNRALQQLNREFEGIRARTLQRQSQTQEAMPVPEATFSEQTEQETTMLQENTHDISTGLVENVPSHENHGLWIITILSVFVALTSASIAYVIYVRSKSEMAALREIVYERYNLLDRRFDLFYQQLTKQDQEAGANPPSGPQAEEDDEA